MTLLAQMAKLDLLAQTPVAVQTRAHNTIQSADLLEAGAAAILPRDTCDTLFLAQLRRLVRSAANTHALDLREDTSRALGLAEPVSTFAFKASPPKITVVAEDTLQAKRWMTALGRMPGADLRHCTPAACLQQGQSGTLPDAFVLCATTPDERRQLPHILVTLRGYPETQHAATLAIDAAPPAQASQDGVWAAHLLDLGVGDVADGRIGHRELILRLNRVLTRKRQEDALRSTVRTGLEASLSDPLTGLHNRRYALPHLSRIAEQSAHQTLPFAVMVLDVDHFKAVNDRYGHAAGDQVLVTLAQRMRTHLRGADLVARIGGEEFLAVLPRTGLEDARHAAQRLCNVIRETPFALSGGSKTTIDVTVSIGLSVFDPADTEGTEVEPEIRDLMAAADDALYQAKKAGRDRVTIIETAA